MSKLFKPSHNEVYSKRGWYTTESLASGRSHSTTMPTGTVTLSFNGNEMGLYDLTFTPSSPDGVITIQRIEGINEARRLYILACNGKPARRKRKPSEPATTPSIVYI